MDQEFVEHLLDDIERVTAPVRGDDPDFKIKLERHLDAFSMSLQPLLTIFWRRPDALRKRKRLWDFAKDYSSGVDGGHVSKPKWWDSSKAKALNEPT